MMSGACFIKRKNRHTKQRHQHIEPLTAPLLEDPASQQGAGGSSQPGQCTGTKVAPLEMSGGHLIDQHVEQGEEDGLARC